MCRLFFNTLIGALVLVIHFREALGVAQAGGQWKQRNIFGGQQIGTGLSVISSDYPTSRHLVKTVNGHLISLSTDGAGDVSMEVIGFVPNQKNAKSQLPPPTARFRGADGSFQDAGAGQGMTQTTNFASNGQVFPSPDAGMSNIDGTAGTNFGSPSGMDQFAGANVQAQGSNGFAAPDSSSFGIAGNSNFQQQQPGAPQQPNGPPFMNGDSFGNQPPNGGPVGPANFPDNPQQPPQNFDGPQNPMGDVDGGNSNFQQQQPGPPPQQSNGPPFMSGDPFGNQQPNSKAAVNGGPVNPQMPSQFGVPQNPIGPGVVPSAGFGHLFRDSDEFQDVSVERDLVLGQNGQIQSRVTISRDSLEYDDASLEVNLNLLPQIRNLLNSQLVPHHQQVNNNPRMVFFQHDDQDNDLSLEYQDILASPVFQQQMQEIDLRLKRAPTARGKRLMEKYAEALALTSGTAPMNNSPFYLSLLFTWISVWLIL